MNYEFGVTNYELFSLRCDYELRVMSYEFGIANAKLFNYEL